MRRNDVDPWCKVAVETIEIDGVEVVVTGLSIGELNALSKEKKSDIEASLDLVCACCERRDGVKLTHQNAMSFRPDVIKQLNDAVARVNGFKPGNSKATDGDTFFSD